MPEYSVILDRPISETYFVEVTADNPGEAIEAAKSAAYNDESPHWEISDSPGGDIEGAMIENLDTGDSQYIEIPRPGEAMLAGLLANVLRDFQNAYEDCQEFDSVTKAIDRLNSAPHCYFPMEKSE